MKGNNEINAVLQPSLGRATDNYKPGSNIGGYLCLAEILKVHHKHGTADIRILGSNSVITSNTENEGKFGAKILTSSALYDKASLCSSGVVEPFQVGQLVVIGFLDNYNRQPVILGSAHNTWRPEQNILSSQYPVDIKNSMEEFREGIKYLRVHPSQFYTKIDGIGSMEMSHPAKTFLKVDPDLGNQISDLHNTYDHEDLSEKDDVTGQTRQGRTEESLLPPKVLFTHRTSHMDEETTWTKVFIDSSGMIRTTRDNNDQKLTYVEISPEGSYIIRRQLDSDTHGGGSSNSEIKIEENGAIQITHHTGSFIRFDNNGDIIIQPAGNLLLG